MRERDEPVRLTKIYTRGGDTGETSLGDGSRVSKLDPRIVAYGVVDELNSQIGVVLAGDLPRKLRTPLTRVQNELFDLGADLSVPWRGPDGRLRVTRAMVDGLERDCDELNEPLPDLKSFVLPGGSEAASRIHVARTVARRAEREPPRARLPESAVRPPVHRRQGGERGRERLRAALEARRRDADERVRETQVLAPNGVYP